MTTFAPSDALVTDALVRSLGSANRVIIEDEVLVTSDFLTYYAAELGWLTPPPPMVYVNGALTSGTVSAVSGSITFATARQPTDHVTASFTFQPYPTAALAACAEQAAYAVAGSLATSFDLTAIGRNVYPAVVLQAHIYALRGLQAESLEYYRWQVDGRTVDKNGVTAHYDRVITSLQKELASALTWLRPQFMAGGRTVTINIDRGLPPTPFSTWWKRSWPHNFSG